MKKNTLLFCTLLLVLSGCANPCQEIDKAINAALRSDKKLTQAEYQTLKALVVQNKDDLLESDCKNRFFDAQNGLDEQKLSGYLVEKGSYFSIDGLDIFSGGSASNEGNKLVKNKFIFNVYLENSASIDGFVNGVTDFESDIYGLLSKIQNRELSQAMHFFYINSVVIPQQNASLKSFIQHIEPNDFRAKGGKRMASDIGEVMRLVLEQRTENSVQILISDCVFSPEKGKNATDYLQQQQTDIENNFTAQLKKMPFDTQLWQMQSNFKGIYYDKDNAKTNLNNKQRPYYIWFFGSNNALQQFNKQIDKANFNAQNTCYLTNENNTQIDYKILMKDGKIGDFDLDKSTPKTKITNAEANQNLFGFAIALNVQNLPLDDQYLQNIANYKPIPNFEITAIDLANPQNPSHNGYTHIIKLQTEKLKSQQIELTAQQKIPLWIAQKHTENDTKINTQLSKTFGLQYLITGVYEAYKNQNDTQTLFTLPIEIKN